MQSSTICRKVLYSGYVQGVGFRYTTERLARGFAVSGYVRNLRDGRVELVAQGVPDQVIDFLAAVRQAMTQHIRDADESELPTTDSHRGFEIRF